MKSAGAIPAFQFGCKLVQLHTKRYTTVKKIKLQIAGPLYVVEVPKVNAFTTSSEECAGVFLLAYFIGTGLTTDEAMHEIRQVWASAEVTA